MRNSSDVTTVGVLALQGAFAEHVYNLQEAHEQLKAGSSESWQNVKLDVKEVRTVKDLDGLAGLVIPGGESTTMAKFLDRWNLTEALLKYMNPGECLLPSFSSSQVFYLSLPLRFLHSSNHVDPPAPLMCILISNQCTCPLHMD